MATHLAEREELKCSLCKRILTSDEYQHVREELQRTHNILADYEEEIYEKDQQIQQLEDTIRGQIPTISHLSDSQRREKI